MNNKIFLLLKEHGLIQQVILQTLLSKKYCIYELERTIGIKAEKLLNVSRGMEKLENDSALKLINLFYEITTQ